MWRCRHRRLALALTLTLTLTPNPDPDPNPNPNPNPNLLKAGKYKTEGKEYVVKDGDIIFFKFNVTAEKKK